MIIVKSDKRSLEVSVAIGPDKGTNRLKYNEVRPPSTIETSFIGKTGDFSDISFYQIDYFGYLKKFTWDSTPCALDDGFSDVIDELISLSAILDGIPKRMFNRQLYNFFLNKYIINCSISVSLWLFTGVYVGKYRNKHKHLCTLQSYSPLHPVRIFLL